MIKNYIIFRDYETAERNPLGAQPTELAAVAIDPRSLEIVPDSIFSTKICPIWDDEQAIKSGWLPVDYKALDVCGFTKQDLENSPQPKVVWQEYQNYLVKYNLKGKNGSNFDSPIVAGFNSSKFDDVIDINMCNKFGPKLNDRGDWTLYHPIVRFDLLHFMHGVLNNIQINRRNSMSMDAIREYFGMDTEFSHRAEFDVLQGAMLLIKFLRLHRNLNEGKLELKPGAKIVYKNSFKAENEKIKQLLQL